ncbi:amino acid ABC transporter substrate-binding protein [Pseudomonas putida]|uniref:ABC transporter substrate-binding protein n=1 Tax=Pseudomonas sp. X4 TaxID=3231526 RepID=UPI0034613845|nr:amino acid ABC transporter substrate-binding protein [Pseudomonas putida]
MKKAASTLGMIALSLLVSTTSAHAKSLDEIQKSGKIVIGTDGTFPPFQFFADGKLSGFEIDIGNEIAKRLGVKADWKPMAFDSLLAGLTQDRWDIVIASFTITDERAKAVQFTTPLYCTGGVVVSNKPNIKSAQDLEGKVVSAQTGSTYFQKATSLPGIKQVRNFASDSDARNSMVAGRSDAWITDKFVAKLSIEKQPDRGMAVGDLLFTEKVASAVKNNNESLASAYDKALDEMKADGTYEKISQKWFNEDIRCL